MFTTVLLQLPIVLLPFANLPAPPEPCRLEVLSPQALEERTLADFDSPEVIAESERLRVIDRERLEQLSTRPRPPSDHPGPVFTLLRVNPFAPSPPFPRPTQPQLPSSGS